MPIATAKLAHASCRSPYKGAHSSTMRPPSFADLFCTALCRSFSFTSLFPLFPPLALVFFPLPLMVEKVSGNMEKAIGCQQKRTQAELTCVLFLTQVWRGDSTPDSSDILPDSCGYS